MAGILVVRADPHVDERTLPGTGGPHRRGEGSGQRGAVAYLAGRGEADFASYLGKDLTPRDLCRLHGTWAAHYG